MSESLSTPYILSLDDDIDFNNLLKAVFKRHHLKIVTTQTVEEFVTHLKKSRPSVCLIDINLEQGPGAGFSLLQAVRKKFDLSVPIIILSRRKEDADIARALELGANDYVSKPIDDAFLLHKVNNYLKQDDIKPLPFYKVTDKDSPCLIDWTNDIIQINEFGLTLQSTHFIAKGTMLKVSGSFVEEVFGTSTPVKLFVNKSWIDSENHLYKAHCEYDYENENILNHVRSYLIANTP